MYVCWVHCALRWLVLTMLICGHAAVYRMTPALAPLTSLVLALPFAQLSLLAAWFGLGPGPFWVRMPLIVVLAICVTEAWRPSDAPHHAHALYLGARLESFVNAGKWGYDQVHRARARLAGKAPAGIRVTSMPTLSREAQNLIVAKCMIVLLCSVLLVLRCRGVSISPLNGPDFTVERLQFPLLLPFGLLTATAIAVPLTIDFRKNLGLIGYVPDVFVVLSTAGMLAANTLLCVWAMLCRGSAWPRLPILLCVGPLLGLGPPWLLGKERDWAWFFYWSIAHGVIVSMSLAVVRACDFVIMRSPKRRSESWRRLALNYVAGMMRRYAGGDRQARNVSGM